MYNEKNKVVFQMTLKKDTVRWLTKFNCLFVTWIDMFFHALKFARSWGSCWKPRPNTSSWGSYPKSEAQGLIFQKHQPGLAYVNALKSHVWLLLLRTCKFNHNASKIKKIFGHYFWPHSHYLANSYMHYIFSINILVSDHGQLSRFLSSVSYVKVTFS